MSEEIKEKDIFQKSIECLANVELNDTTYTIARDIVLDYITNLQKENVDLKKLCDKYEEEHNTAFKLWKANMEKIPPFDKFLDYKQRNEKAIKLLKKAGCYDEETKTFCDDIWDELEILLNILQGGDE